MNRFIITLLLASQLPLHAQEVSAELRSNISELISIRVANRQRSIADSLGKAFRPDIYREQFNKILLGGTPVENDDATDCPAATAMANSILKQFDPQDYDAAGILQRVETHLATPAPETEEEMKKAYEEYEKLTEQVHVFPILNPPPSPYHPSGSSQCTSPKHPVSCIEPGLVTHFIYDTIHISMPFSQIIPPSPSPTESKRLFYTSVSLLLSRIQGYCYHLSKFHIYALVYCIGVFLSGLLHSV